MIRNKYEINSNKYDNIDFISDEKALEYVDNNKLLFCHLSNYEKYETGINQLIETFLNEYLKKKTQKSLRLKHSLIIRGYITLLII